VTESNSADKRMTKKSFVFVDIFPVGASNETVDVEVNSLLF